MRKINFLSVIFFLPSFCFASNLGNYGQVFEVKETDIREVIHNKLTSMEKSGEMEVRKKQMMEKVSQQIIRPQSLNLPKLNETVIHYVDPSVIVNNDIYTPKGQLIAKAGTSVNPFARIQFNKALFFFDSDDDTQVQWAKANYQKYKQVKFILTSGSVQTSSKIFGRVYFDLKGELTTKLKITSVPAVAVQEGLQWKLTQVCGLR